MSTLVQKDMHYPSSYVVWDLETSGLDPTTSKILEIGAIVIRDGVKVDEHNWVLNNNIEIPEEIVKITGITKEIIEKEGKDPKTCLEEFMQVLKASEYVNLTHNGIKFDIPFLLEQLAQHDLLINHEQNTATKFILNNRAVDTAVMVKAKKIKMVQNWSENFYKFALRVMDTRAYGVKFNVGICCEELGIDKTGLVQHRTGADTYLTNEIYKKLINQK